MWGAGGSITMKSVQKIIWTSIEFIISYHARLDQDKNDLRAIYLIWWLNGLFNSEWYMHLHKYFMVSSICTRRLVIPSVIYDSGQFGLRFRQGPPPECCGFGERNEELFHKDAICFYSKKKLFLTNRIHSSKPVTIYQNTYKNYIFCCPT